MSIRKKEKMKLNICNRKENEKKRKVGLKDCRPQLACLSDLENFGIENIEP